MEKRAPIYEACADVVVEVSDKSFDEILQSIMEKIKDNVE